MLVRDSKQDPSCAHSILVRDSKQDPSHAPTLHVSPLTWAAFTSAVR
ncbi:DUF397 domain-containing protein [Streptomyces sp. SID685]